ncbi:MAG: LEA type 2 family protein [Deltaproteobacteria bacterium]|nr:LEA type 2 family protein [Deltaproteobacteria bacterium]
MHRLAPVVIALVASGCAMFMKSVEKPKVDVRDVAVTSASFTGLDGEVRLDVMNPNPVGVPLRAVDWQLAVGSAQAVSGRIELSETIPAKGTAPVTAALHLDAAHAINVGRAIAGGASDYTLDARFYFATALGEVAVDVHHQGTLVR